MFEGLAALLNGTKVKTAEPVVVSLRAEPAPVDFTDDKRPVIESEEKDETLPMRTPGRIQCLLQTFEAERMDRTEARIKNDTLRYVNSQNKPRLGEHQ